MVANYQKGESAMTRDEAYALQEIIEDETRWRNVGIKQFASGWVTVIGKGKFDIYVWSLEDWYSYRATMSQQVPVKPQA
jgi:hypothetical protein